LEFNRLLVQKGPRIPRSDFVEDWKATMLRAEHYDVVKAVTRCSRHWNIKSDWFGTPDLKTIVRDLAPNLVQKGYVQLVPVRDCKGRAVVCLHFRPNLYSSHEREVRAVTRSGYSVMHGVSPFPSLYPIIFLAQKIFILHAGQCFGRCGNAG
jgi:hypothetical protein